MFVHILSYLVTMLLGSACPLLFVRVQFGRITYIVLAQTLNHAQPVRVQMTCLQHAALASLRHRSCTCAHVLLSRLPRHLQWPLHHRALEIRSLSLSPHSSTRSLKTSLATSVHQRYNTLCRPTLRKSLKRQLFRPNCYQSPAKSCKQEAAAVWRKRCTRQCLSVALFWMSSHRRRLQDPLLLREGRANTQGKAMTKNLARTARSLTMRRAVS